MILGIDVGITGAWALLTDSGGPVFSKQLPSMANGKKNAKVKTQLNAGEWARELRALPGPSITFHTAYVEMVSAMPKQGVASMFSLGHSFGTVCAVLATLQIPFWLVTPPEWKKEFQLLGAADDAARTLAIRLFPSIILGFKKDHNRADALLIAEYGRRKYNGTRRGEALTIRHEAPLTQGKVTL